MKAERLGGKMWIVYLTSKSKVVDKSKADTNLTVEAETKAKAIKKAHKEHHNWRVQKFLRGGR